VNLRVCKSVVLALKILKYRSIVTNYLRVKCYNTRLLLDKLRHKILLIKFWYSKNINYTVNKDFLNVWIGKLKLTKNKLW